MGSVAIKCPNCGATEGTPAPHATRICAFCGTHYLLRPELRAEPEPVVPAGTIADPGTNQQWFNLGCVMVIVAAVFVGIVFLTAWLLRTDKPVEKSSMPGVVPYNAPRSPNR